MAAFMTLALILTGLASVPFSLFGMVLSTIFVLSKALPKRRAKKSHLVVSIIYLLVTVLAIWHAFAWVTINDSGPGNTAGLTLMLWMNMPGIFTTIYVVYYFRVIRRKSKSIND